MTIITLPVRRAVPADRPEVLQMCRDGFKEHGMFRMDEAKVNNMLDRAFNDGGAVIGVLGDSGKLQGAIYLLISQFWYTGEWCLEELFSYVLPPYRRSTNAKDLIAFGKRAAEELEVPLVIGVVANERMEAKMALYKRQLGTPTGGYFAYNMPQRDLYAEPEANTRQSA